VAIKSFQPDLNPQEYKVAIVVSQFNEMVTKPLYEGCVNQLRALQVQDENIEVFHCPGAFELPMITKRVFKSRSVAGVITLGAVIRGDTAHFDYVAGPCASQLSALSVEFAKPVIFGVLTTETLEQALHRAGGKYGNKGAEAAITLHHSLRVLELAGI